MKRKRRPAPHSKKSRPKKTDDTRSEALTEEKDSSEWENESFEGFSDDEVEDVEETVAASRTSAAVNGHANNASKKQKKSAPTQEELMELHFRSSSFQSNLFKLQVDELLSEVRVRYDKMDKVERVLHRVKDILLQLPGSQEQLVASFRLC